MNRCILSGRLLVVGDAEPYEVARRARSSWRSAAARGLSNPSGEETGVLGLWAPARVRSAFTREIGAALMPGTPPDRRHDRSTCEDGHPRTAAHPLGMRQRSSSGTMPHAIASRVSAETRRAPGRLMTRSRPLVRRSIGSPGAQGTTRCTQAFPIRRSPAAPGQRHEQIPLIILLLALSLLNSG